MSQPPPYNPYNSGNQRSTRGSYRLTSMQAERDPRRATSGLGPGSSFSSSAASSASPANAGRRIPSLLNMSVSYRPDQSRAGMDKDKEGSKDTHSSRAREEVRFVGQPDHQPIGQSTRYSSTQRDDILSSGTGTTSYSIASTPASLGHRHSDVDGGSRSLDWFPKYKKAATDDSSKFYPSTASSSYTSSGGSKFNSSSDRARDVQSIPGLGDFDYPVLDKPPTETSRPKYTSECASNILLQFGLEKEDLEYLVSYPDDQMTPANLPFILRQIRNQKAKRSSTAVESGPYPATRPIRGMSGMGSLSSSGGSSAVLQPAKVIDYGHTGNYAGGVVDEIGRTSGSGGSGSLSLVDTRDSRSHHSQDRTEVKSSALGSSRGQGSSVTNSSYNSVMRSVAPLSSDPAQRLKTPLGSSSLPRKESDRTVYMSVASKSHPSKEPGPQSASKSQPPCTLFRSVHPDRPSLVLIGSNETIDTENRRVTQGKGSSVAEQKQTQMPQNQPQMQQRQMLLKPTKQKQSQLQQNQSQLQQNQKQQSQRQQNQRQLNQKQQNQKQQNQRQQNQRQQNQRQQKQTQQKQPASLMGRAMRPLDFSAAQSVPPAPVIPSNTKRSGFVPLSCAIPPLQSVQRQDPAKRPVAKGLPARFMVYDYAAVTPKVFPHTCTLCCKECTSIKEWHSHQSSSLHLDTCRVFRAKYPEWNGDIELELSTGRRETEPSPTTYQQRPKKTSLGSRSHSPSPRRGKRSRTRSPRSFRYTLSSLSRSRSPRCDRYRSRSGSHERQWRRDDRQSSSRSAERWSSPGRSRERRPSPRRRDDKRSSPRRSRERRPSPRRKDDKRYSPRRSRERQPSPRRRDDNRSSPRRSDERRSSPKRSREGRTLSETSPGQKKSSSAETLAKNLLKTSAVQSLSKQSDLEAVVKCLAPALLAELAKMKSSSLTSSTSTKGGKSAGRKSSSSAASSSASTAAAKKKQTTTTSTKANSEASASSKSQVDEDSPPNVVKLKGVHGSFSHAEVVTAVEQFGKTISVVLFRSKREAVVRFEKDEDAKKLKSEKSIAIKGFPVTVVKEKDDEQKTPQKKPTVSSVSKPLTSKATKTTMPQRNTTYGKRTNEKTVAKGSTKVTKANILVAKAKNASTKLIAKRAKPAVEQVDTAEVDESANVTVAEPTQVSESVTEVKVKEETASSSAAGATIKEEVEEKSATPTKETLKSTNSGNRTDVETSESKELDTKVQSVEELEDTVKVEPGNRTVSELKHQAKPAKVKAEVKEDAEPMTLRETGVEVAEPMEVEPCAEVKVEQLTSTEAVTDKPSESRPAPSTDETNAPTVLPPNAEADGQPADTSGPIPRTDMKTPEAPDEPSSQLLEPESAAPVLEVKMEASQPSSSAEGMEENTIEKDPVSAMTSQSDPVSADDASEPVGNVSTKPTTEVVSRQQPTATSSKSVSVETADSSVETRVVENFDTFSTDSASEGVARLETRLENSSEVALEAETPTDHTPSELSDNGPQPVLQTSSPPSAEPAAPDESITREDVTVESSAIAAGDVEKEVDGKELGAEIVLDSTVGPQVANEDVEEVAEREEGSPTARDATADAAFGPTHSSEETTAELPQIDQDTFTALVAALHRHRLTKDTRARSDKKEARGDAYDCTEQNFNMNDFVTVDEVVGDDAEETSPDPRRSASSKRPSRGRKEPQSLDASSDDKRPSTRSLRDSKRSSSSSSSSSKSTKDSTKRSSSSNSTKDSSRSTKSSTRPSSSLLSPETPSSPDHKTKQSKTRSPVKASKTSSSSCRTRSSRSSETLPESQREDVEATESAVPTSDHRVSAEGIAANAVESETKIETSPETHPPAQGQGLRLNQVQNLETDFKDNTLNDLEKAKVNNNSETCPEKCSEMELDSSLQAVDGATQNQAQQLFEKELPLNVCDRKDPKDLTCDVTQQETFEILDSVDDQTAIDDETSGAQISKEDIGRIDKEEDTSRSGLRTRQDRTETSRKIVYEMDSVEDEPVQDATTTERSVRRRSQRGKKEDKTEVSEKPYGDAEASFEVLDSVEDETATEEPTTTTSTRGRRERTSKKDSQVNKTKEEDTPTRRRRTPARESQEAKKSDITVRESRNEDATYEILDSVEEEEVVKDDRPATGGRGKRKRPKKAVKATKNETVTLKKGDKDKEADEEEVLFQILDSVEDEMVDDHPSTEQSVSARKKKTSKNDKLVEQSSSLSGSPRNEEEEEPVYQIVDSVEDDQEESVKETSNTNDETCPKEEVPAVKEDSPTCSSVVVEASEELVAMDSEDLSAVTLVTLDEAGDNEKADEAEQSPRSAKRKHDDDVTEESVNFVTVDEVEVEEEEEEEEQEAAPRTRGRPKKRTRKTPVRKSTRGNRDGAKDEREDERESSGSDVPPLKDPSTLSSDGQREIQKSEGGGASQAHVDAASAGQDLRPEHPESQSLERCMEEGEEEEEEEGWSRPDVKVVTKRKSELVGPEAKRSRSQSPCVAADLNLPPFSPNNPLGQEFVVPKSGYFCNLCRVFYLNESSAKEDHCGSQRHYDNLQKYFQKHRHKPPTSTSPHSQGLASD